MAGAALRVLDTLSNPLATEPEPPLTEVGQAALRDNMLSSLGTMPFLPGTLISRSLWLIFICPRGFRNPVVLPIDDRLDLPKPDKDAARPRRAHLVFPVTSCSPSPSPW